MIKTGLGFDAHQLKTGEKLVVGGVDIPHDKGSVGHSDGDALIHAIVDALLGAAGLGDIGMYFPSDSSEWKNAPSRIFLERAAGEVRNKGFDILHIDATVVLQNPRLRPYLKQIMKNLCSIMDLPGESLSVKATTTDHLGYEGKGLGWSVQAIATLQHG